MKLLLACLPVLLACVWMTPPARAGEPTLGQPHPEVRLPTIDGRDTLSLQALRGSKVLLIQFASW
jgi:hypothetical protein